MEYKVKIIFFKPTQDYGSFEAQRQSEFILIFRPPFINGRPQDSVSVFGRGFAHAFGHLVPFFSFASFLKRSHQESQGVTRSHGGDWWRPGETGALLGRCQSAIRALLGCCQGVTGALLGHRSVIFNQCLGWTILWMKVCRHSNKFYLINYN